MEDRDDSSQPRKRIAVACSRCRKRKIRCSGDPGNGAPCSNCKNAGYEPCLFLRVSSQETPLRNDGSDYTYNLDAARTYAAQSRGSISALNPIAEYTNDMPTGSVMASYRGTAYPIGSKGYYQTMSGWTGAYTEDGVDYGMNYPAYPIMGQDTTHMAQGYARYSNGKSVYVDPEASTYSYGNLVHRPAATGETQNFSFSSMAASLPSSSDRLHSQVNRTLTSSASYRADGLPTQYSSNKTSPSSSLSDVGYSSLTSSFESPYSATNALPSSVSHRSTSQADNAAYQSGANTTAEALYSSSDPTLRSVDDSTSGLSYIYSDSTKLDTSRRDSHSSGGTSTGSVLSNGHVYVPESHHPHVSSQATYASQGNVYDGSGATPSAGGGGGGSSHLRTSDGHRRSAGSLRGG